MKFTDQELEMLIESNIENAFDKNSNGMRLYREFKKQGGKPSEFIKKADNKELTESMNKFVESVKNL